MKKNTKHRISKRFILIILTIIVLMFSIFKLGSTFASTDSFTITNVEVISKTSTTEVSGVSFDGTNISSDVTFHSVNDSIIYKITIKNNEEKVYTIKSLADSNQSENITFIYDSYAGTKLNPGEQISILVTEKYSKEVTDLSKRSQANAVNLTLTFEDEAGNIKEDEVVINPENDKPTDEKTIDENKTATDNTATEETGKETDGIENNIPNANNDTETTEITERIPVENKTKNPKTGDNVGIYITTAIGSTILLIVLSRKQLLRSKKAGKTTHAKHGKRMLGLILAIAIIAPAFSSISNAATTLSLEAKFNGTVNFMDKVVISYTVNGETKEIVIGYNETIENIEEPAKEGYIFRGWTLGDGTPFDEATEISSDLVLIPQFEELVKSSEITITVADEEVIDTEKEVEISAVNTNIADEKVQLQYSLDNGETWLNYEDAITVTQSVTLKARTIVIENEEVIGTAEKEIEIDENLAKLRAYFVGKGPMDVYGEGEFLDNEIIPDASSSISEVGESFTNATLIKYNNKLYTLTANQEEENIIFDSVERSSDLDRIKSYFASYGTSKIDPMNYIFEADEEGILETNLKVVYCGMNAEQTELYLFVEYNDKTYKVTLDPETEEITNVEDLNTFNPTDEEILRDYLTVFIDEYDSDNNEFPKDSFGMLETNIRVLSGDPYQLPMLVLYNGNIFAVKDGMVVEKVASDMTDLQRIQAYFEYGIDSYNDQFDGYDKDDFGILEEDIYSIYYTDLMEQDKHGEQYPVGFIEILKYKNKIYKLTYNFDTGEIVVEELYDISTMTDLQRMQAYFDYELTYFDENDDNKLIKDEFGILEENISIVSMDENTTVSIVTYKDNSYIIHVTDNNGVQKTTVRLLDFENMTDLERLQAYFDYGVAVKNDETNVYEKDSWGILEEDVDIIQGRVVRYKNKLFGIKTTEDNDVEKVTVVEIDLDNLTDLERLQAYFDYELDRTADTETIEYIPDEIGFVESNIIYTLFGNIYSYKDAYYKIEIIEGNKVVSISEDIDLLKASYVKRIYSDVVNINRQGEKEKRYSFKNAGLITDAENIDVLYYNYFKYNGKTYRIVADLDVDAESFGGTITDSSAHLLSDYIWSDMITDIQEVDTTDDLQILQDYFVDNIKQDWDKVRQDMSDIIYLAELNEDSHIIVYHGTKYILKGNAINSVNISEVSKMTMNQSVENSQINTLNIYERKSVYDKILSDCMCFDFKEDVTYKIYEDTGVGESHYVEYDGGTLTYGSKFKLVLTGKDSGTTKEIIIITHEYVK